MVKKSEQAAAADSVKRLTDYVQQGVQFEGDKISFENLLGEDFELIDYAALPSKMGQEIDLPDGTKKKRNFLVMQIKYKGKVYTTSTGAAQVVDAVEQLPKQYLPVLIKAIKDFNPDTKRTYYRVE